MSDIRRVHRGYERCGMIEIKRNPELIDRKVIEDIKAEIYEELKNDEGASYGLGLALGIIDKHISGDMRGDTE